MKKITRWFRKHPDVWEFVLFNILSNCATITNFIVMWICTGYVFRKYAEQPFQFWIFQYTNVESDLGLCGFLSFLLATAAAQTVNFFVQKYLVFRSDVGFGKAVPKYIALAVVLVIISAALPGYSQALLRKIGIPQLWVPTLANVINILVQVIISYPTMKFVIMKDQTKEKQGLEQKAE